MNSVEELQAISRAAMDAYMAGFAQAYDRLPPDRPTHHGLAGAYDMGSASGMRYRQDENDRVG